MGVGKGLCRGFNSELKFRHIFEGCIVTRSGRLELLGSYFSQIFRQFVPARVKILSKTPLVASRYTIKGKRPHFWLTYIIQKHFCLSSLMSTDDRLFFLHNFIYM